MNKGRNIDSALELLSLLWREHINKAHFATQPQDVARVWVDRFSAAPEIEGISKSDISKMVKSCDDCRYFSKAVHALWCLSFSEGAEQWVV